MYVVNIYTNVVNKWIFYHVVFFFISVCVWLSPLALVFGTGLIKYVHSPIITGNTFFTASHKPARKNPKRVSLYSIEFSPQLDIRQGDSDSQDTEQLPAPIPPKPMTPRRVKRRSVMTRGTTNRHSTSSRRHSTARSSTRSSRRVTQNPVTRLLEQQQKIQAYDSPNTPSPIETLPHYYTNVSSNNLVHPKHGNWSNGHANPTYQQSSIQSLNEPDDLDELYNNRPASVRSSYSNFHGTRAINYAAKQYHSHATPQVPQKRANNPNRHSMRSVAFLNNGPPAYTSQGHACVDSETTI